MDGEHATETTEKSGLVDAPPPILDVADASATSLLCEAHKRLTAEMETTPCNQTNAARHAVKAALEVLDARNQNRVAAAKG